MELEKLESEYKKLNDEVEKLRFHLKLTQMMLPEDSNYAFFQYIITMNLSEAEEGKILKPLTKMNATMNGREFLDELYSVGDEAIEFDASVSIKQWGNEYMKYVNILFNGEVNPLHILKACNKQGLYSELCTLLINQIES